MGDIFPELIDAFRWKGSIYGIPNQFYTFVVYYNKELFDKENIEYPSAIWTWQDCIALAKKLTRKDAKGVTIHYGLSNLGPHYFNLIARQMGVRIFNKDRTKCILDNPKAVKAAQFIIDMLDKHKVVPTPSEGQSFGPMQLFQMGKAAMHISGQWLIPELRNYKDLKWSVAPMPRFKEKKTLLGIHAFVISSQTKHPEQAWKFVKFVASPEAQKLIARLRINIPVSKTVVYSEDFVEDKQRPREGNRIGVDALKYSLLWESSTNCTVDFASDTINRELDKCFAYVGEQNAEQAMKNIARHINNQLQGK